MFKPRALTLASLILAAAASRLIPHPWNLTSVAALALFGGATFEDRRLAFLAPLAALALSDLVLGFYPGMAFVYASFLVVAALGLWLRGRRAPGPILAASLAGSLLFFVLTNFGVWAEGLLYPRTLAGLAACYAAALPFLRQTLEGDLLYTVLLFGGFALLERRFPVLRPAAALPQPA
jgi:hypothetical protein